MKKLLVIFASFISIMGLGQKASDSIHYENLVFEGAGIRGLAYCGALMELDERKMLTPIQRLAGTSSGAITATLLSVGYTPQEIFEMIGNTNFAEALAKFKSEASKTQQP